MRILIAIACLAGILAVTTVNAAGLRCGNDLVATGDAITSVIDKCGSPKYQTALRNDEGEQIGEILYFDPGDGKADRKVTFRDGNVTRIERVR